MRNGENEHAALIWSFTCVIFSFRSASFLELLS